jgi:hypothetical protein
MQYSNGRMSATRRALLDPERDQLDRPAQVEVVGRSLVLAFVPRGLAGRGLIGRLTAAA